MTILNLTILLLSWSCASSFTTVHKHASHHSHAASSLYAVSPQKSVLVVSPPGGVGQVAACYAAEQGASVKWFVIRKGDDTAPVQLTPQTLERIKDAAGSIDIAGADTNSFQQQSLDSSLSALQEWCRQDDKASLICAMDIGEVAPVRGGTTNKQKILQDAMLYENAIKIAAQEAAKQIGGTKIAIVSDDTSSEAGSSSSDKESTEGGIGKFASSLFKGKVNIPTSLQQAVMPSQGAKNPVVLLRHGSLFGLPESSPEFSPLVGGLRQAPELCEEYVNRQVRVDLPFMKMSRSSSSGTRTSRHAIGQIAAYVATGIVDVSKQGAISKLDVSIASQRGSDEFSVDDWKTEFDRVTQTIMKRRQATANEGGMEQLFVADDLVISNPARMADWLASKWAPAVMRTYDIAAIRTGERPVYALRADDDSEGNCRVDIVFQKLVNFETQTVGKIVLTVTDDALIAERADTLSPLNGESVLVRQLAEAAAQAVEKGLASKKKKKQQKKQPEPEPVVAAAAPVPVPEPVQNASGPRQAGARRSRERTRGKRVQSGNDSSDNTESDTDSSSFE